MHKAFEIVEKRQKLFRFDRQFEAGTKAENAKAAGRRPHALSSALRKASAFFKSVVYSMGRYLRTFVLFVRSMIL